MPAHELVSRIQDEDSWVQLTRVANRRPQAGKATEALPSRVLGARAVAGTRSLWLQAVVHIILQGGGGNRCQSRLISQSAAATLLRAVSSDASQHPPPWHSALSTTRAAAPALASAYKVQDRQGDLAGRRQRRHQQRQQEHDAAHVWICVYTTCALPLIAYLWNRFGIVRTSCDAWLRRQACRSRRAALSCTPPPSPRPVKQRAVSQVFGPAHHPAGQVTPSEVGFPQAGRQRLQVLCTCSTWGHQAARVYSGRMFSFNPRLIAHAHHLDLYLSKVAMPQVRLYLQQKEHPDELGNGPC